MVIHPLREFPFHAWPMIVAHRGDTDSGAPENSIDAIRAAIQTGADMIEVDVQWTSDEVFVCYHDETIAGLAKPIHSSTWEELRATNVARLADVLELARDHCYLNLEIKEYSDRDPKRFMAALESIVVRTSMQEHVLLSSFRIDYLQQAAWLLPTVVIHPDDRIQQFFNSRSKSPIVTERPVSLMLPSEVLRLSHATSYACQIGELTPEHLDDIRKHNILLSVYTITTPEEFDRAVALGAKALVCEHPSQFTALRNTRYGLNQQA